MTENKDKIPRQCIIKDRGYNSYYYGGACYGSELCKAIVFEEDKIPEYIKNNPNEEEIIFLDTKKGLELIAKEYERLQRYVDIYQNRVNEAKEGMKKLGENKNLQKYIDQYNKWHNPLIGISEDTKNKIIEDIVNSKD